MKEDDDESPYCELCNSCGEEGCCSFIKCFRELVFQNDECKYDYVKDAIFAKEIAELGSQVITKLENGLFSSESAVKEYRSEWNKIYDEVYKDHNQGLFV